MSRAIALKQRNQTISIILLVIISMLMVSYLYFLNSTLRAGVVINTTEDSIISATSRVSDLESEYFNEKRNATLAYAKTLGFEEGLVTIYVSKAPPKKLLSLTNEN